MTAVVVRGDEILLGHRSDNGALTPVTGIVDPGEEPADAACREALEEAGVVIRADRLVFVHQIPRITYDNGDQSDYLDLTFRCSWVGGEPYPADGEMTSVGWYRLEPATWSDWMTTCAAVSRSRSPTSRPRCSRAVARAQVQRRSSRMSTRGNPFSTDPVSAALVNPAFSNSRRVPT